MISEKLKFNEELLTEYLQRDNSMYINNSGTLNGESFIYFLCNCGKEAEKSFYSIVRNGGAFCSECIRNNKILKSKKSCIEKYGIDNVMYLDTIKEKVKLKLKGQYGEITKKREETMLNKYGHKYPTQIEDIKNKIKDTCLKRYNTTNPLLNTDIQEKIKKTNNEKYGCENVFSNKDIQEKIIQTNLEKRGVEYAFQSEEVKDKIKETCLQKYGYEFAIQNDKIKQKSRNGQEKAFLQKYGCHPQQCSQIYEKTKNTSLKFKDYTMPSGAIRKIQGYEDKALNELITIYDEDDIISDRSLVPRIKYLFKDKYHYYFPDIFVKSQNKIIEVKSEYTYKLEPERIQLKSEATKQEGYSYEIWVYLKNGEKQIF